MTAALEVWVVCCAGILEIDGPGSRLFRDGQLATALADRGHRVTWWTSTFNHPKRTHRADRDTTLPFGARGRIRMLRGLGYQRSISVQRIVDHRMIGWKFARQARDAPQPDVIYASMPTLDLAREAVRFGRETGTPVMLDIRDQWPEIWLELVPPRVRGVARMALTPLFRDLKVACRDATAITGITEAFVEWGVQHAGRAPTPSDRAHRLGYSETSIAETDLARARGAWEARGVVRDDSVFTLCYFGGLTRSTRLDDVLSVARALEQGGGGFRFLFAGRGDRLDKYEDAARGLKSVVFAGWIDQAELRIGLELSDAGLVPYKPEPTFLASYPNKVGEYFSSSLPVVTTLGDGLLGALLRERECGVSYPAGDLDELRRVLVDLASDRKRHARMRAAARALYEEQFSADEVYRDMAEHLESLVPPR